MDLGIMKIEISGNQYNNKEGRSVVEAEAGIEAETERDQERADILGQGVDLIERKKLIPVKAEVRASKYIIK